MILQERKALQNSGKYKKVSASINGTSLSNLQVIESTYAALPLINNNPSHLRNKGRYRNLRSYVRLDSHVSSRQRRNQKLVKT